LEFIGWARKFAVERSELARADRVVAEIGGRPFFLFPLQLSNDFQIREHSPFQDMKEAVQYVLASFARRASPDVILLIKEHPLDASLTNWRHHVNAVASRLGVGDRVVHIRGSNLVELAAAARGLVTVNSTSSTLSLAAGVPTIALGKVIYNLPGITHQGRLDDFWLRPQAPDAAVFDAFRRVLYDRCLIYGGLASESATRTLVESALERLVGDRISHWRPALVAAQV
jgi:capsular polysaccharide export protein